jgi:hypothetical protein
MQPHVWRRQRHPNNNEWAWPEVPVIRVGFFPKAFPMETRVFGGSERRRRRLMATPTLTLRVARGGAMAVRRGRGVAAGAGAAIVLSGADVGPAAPEVIALRLPRPLLRSLVRSRRRRGAAAAAQHAGATAARALSRIPARRQGAGRSGAPARGGRACLRPARARAQGPAGRRPGATRRRLEAETGVKPARWRVSLPEFPFAAPPAFRRRRTRAQR